MKPMALDTLDEQRELSGYVLCNWPTSLRVPTIHSFLHGLQQVSQEREEILQAQAAPRTINSLCPDPGRMEVRMGKNQAHRQPLPEAGLPVQAGTWAKLLLCSRMTLGVAGRGHPKLHAEECQDHEEESKEA